MANRSHLIGIGESYARNTVLRNNPELEVDSSSINSKTCSLSFHTPHCSIAVKFPTELLEEIHMSGSVKSYNEADSDGDDECCDDDVEESVKPKRKALMRKGK